MLWVGRMWVSNRRSSVSLNGRDVVLLFGTLWDVSDSTSSNRASIERSETDKVSIRSNNTGMLRRKGQ